MVAEPLLISEVEHPTAFDPVKPLDLADQLCPLGRGQPVQFAGRPPENLGEVKDGERPLLDAGRGRGRCPPTQLGPETVQRAGEVQFLAGRVRKSHAFQHQPHGQEPGEAIHGNGVRYAVAAVLQLADHARPPSQGDEGLRHILVPLVLRHSEPI